MTTHTMDDLVEREGLYYKKFTDIPFTGEVTEGFEHGWLKNGKRDGPWVAYYENGQLWSEGDWKDGKRDGPWIAYWSNGQLRLEGDYKDGKEDGPWVWYWSNSQLWEKGDYKDGKREGPWADYHEDGTKDEVYSGAYHNGEKMGEGEQ